MTPRFIHNDSRLLPKSNLVKLTMCHEYLRKLLLSPPPYEVADTIHNVCASLMNEVTRSLPASFERPMHASHVVQVISPTTLTLQFLTSMSCSYLIHVVGITRTNVASLRVWFEKQRRLRHLSR